MPSKPSPPRILARLCLLIVLCGLDNRGAAAAPAIDNRGAAAAPAIVPAASAQAPPAAAAPAADKPAGGDDFNFDILADPTKPAPPSASENLAAGLRAERQGRIRRNMLNAHQVVGFITLASLAATLIVGHLNYQDKYVSGDFSGRYEMPHLGLSIATTGLFTGTGVLALFAPNPYPKPYRFDRAMIHRVSMALATAGMVAQIILGPVIVARSGYQDQPRIALGHVITGYATFAFMTAGVVSYVF